MTLQKINMYNYSTLTTPLKATKRRMPILKINSLTKIYAASNKGIKDLTLHIEKGDLFAFIGHNGAGKASALKAICGIHGFENGEITVCGINVKEDGINAKKADGVHS